MREVMFRLTGARRWNPTKKFRGQRVTLHGATRHTSASLLLFNKVCPQAAPSEHVVMEIQQRSDARVFRRHYCHAEEQQVKAALKYGSPPSICRGSEVESGGLEIPAEAFRKAKKMEAKRARAAEYRKNGGR